MAKTDKDDLISRKSLKNAKFPVVTNQYTEGWNDAIDSIIASEPPAGSSESEEES